jgi:hypothetical protein
MTSDSKDSHEGHVALEDCRHENLEPVYHIQVALILSARQSQQSNGRKKFKEIVSLASLGSMHSTARHLE